VRSNTATLISTPLTPTTTDRLRIRSLSGPTHQPSYARVKHVPPGDDPVDASLAVGLPGVLPGDHSRGDAVYIRLWQCNARETRQWRGEIVIHVGRDIDGLHAAYVKRGVEVTEPPTSQPWGLREFAIREPDGHVLRFCGYL